MMTLLHNNGVVPKLKPNLVLLFFFIFCVWFLFSPQLFALIQSPISIISPFKYFHIDFIRKFAVSWRHHRQTLVHAGAQLLSRTSVHHEPTVHLCHVFFLSSLPGSHNFFLYLPPCLMEHILNQFSEQGCRKSIFGELVYPKCFLHQQAGYQMVGWKSFPL